MIKEKLIKKLIANDNLVLVPKGGRPKKITQEQEREIKEKLKLHSVKEVMTMYQELGLSRATFYNLKKGV